MTRPAAPRAGADRDPDGLDRYYTPVATARRRLGVGDLAPRVHGPVRHSVAPAARGGPQMTRPPLTADERLGAPASMFVPVDFLRLAREPSSALNLSVKPTTRTHLDQIRDAVSRRTGRPVSASEAASRALAYVASLCEADPAWVPEAVGVHVGRARWTSEHTCAASGPHALQLVTREIGDGLIYITDGARPVVSGRQAAGVQPAHLDGAALVAVDGEVDHTASLVLQLVLALSAQTWSVAPPAQSRCRRVMRVRA